MYNFSQLEPVNPAAQLQRYEPGTFTHSPALRHGDGSRVHSSTSFRQRGPLYPGGHLQENVPSRRDAHVPPLEHGEETQLFTRSHRSPVHPGEHWQVYRSLGRREQMPPLLQGFLG